MGKRKAGRGGTSQKDDPQGRSIVSRFSVEDTFADSEDDFFAGRDKVLLEDGPAQKKRRKLDEEEKFLEPSDEEVLQYADSDASESGQQSADASGSEAGEKDEEDDDAARGWGTSKADYYNADVIETEADALEEEAEARRMQQKKVQSMAEADFGFDEIQWAQDMSDQKDNRRTVVEKLPDIQISDSTAEVDRLKILKSRYPEFEPLAKDFADLQNIYQDHRLAAEAAQVVVKHTSPRKKADKGETQTPGAVTKYRALSAYLGAIAMYFALLTSPSKSGLEGQISAMPANELREHPVMEMLVECRQLWHRAQDVKDSEVAELTSVDGEQTLADKSTNKDLELALVPKPSKKPKTTNKTSTPTRLESTASVDGDIQVNGGLPDEGVARPGKRKKRRRQNDLETLLARVQTSKADPDGEEISNFGDETPLTAEEAAEKARRKKSLRFYSSQIVQKSNKRGAASRDAGGDDDLPRKERLRDRQARLLELAEKRGRQAPDQSELLNNDEADEISHSGSDGYYDVVANKSIRKKAEKKARAEVYAEAAKQGGEVYAEEQIGPDGKRAITYAIEKNKGLMPRRKKDVRNPRVKKRKKYDEKMKKLGSVRQVYKGGEGRGGYGGELTGIKTNIVKSVKL